MVEWVEWYSGDHASGGRATNCGVNGATRPFSVTALGLLLFCYRDHIPESHNRTRCGPLRALMEAGCSTTSSHTYGRTASLNRRRAAGASVRMKLGTAQVTMRILTLQRSARAHPKARATWLSTN